MAETKLNIVVNGAGGRMGLAVIGALHGQARLHAALEQKGSPLVGKSAGADHKVLIGDDLSTALLGADAIIDFSAPAASVALARLAAQRGLIHIIGTTGCSSEDDRAIAEAAKAGARIVKSGNFSLGVNVLIGLVKQAAQLLPDFDIEILEMHHNKKVDAPSGTALMLGEAAAAGRNIGLKQNSVRARDGHTGPRQAGSIGFAALRGGTVIGDHSVILAGENERIELVHRAQDRAMFAAGAVRAALWARDKQPGLYAMADVLGFID